MIDKGQVRRAFSRHGGGGDLYGEVAERLVVRLDEIALSPSWVVDVGGDGAMMRRRFPQARVVGLDFSRRRLGSAGVRVVGDAERLPLATAAADLLWANLCFDWTDLGLSLGEAARVLRRKNGVLVFSMLGRDSLQEARAVFGEGGRVHDFMDMHDIGDRLAASGFYEIVMETEVVRLTYANAADALREIHLAGAGNALHARRRGWLGRQRWQQAMADYQQQFSDDSGRVMTTFELIYGLCWRRDDVPSEQVVHFR